MTGQLLISDLIQRNAKGGVVRWLGLRPARRVDLLPVERVDITASGLVGDHRAKPGKRAVTLIQYEHLVVIASLLGRDAVLPEQMRRNIVVSGINLLGLRNRSFTVGDAVLAGNGLCAPCSRMEEEFGHGGYSAVRGHGGICASVVHGGSVSLGGVVQVIDDTCSN